jgi:hypothetical protein
MGRFSWGRPIEDFVVGPYTVRSFHPFKTKGSSITKEIDYDTVNYHGYIDGLDANEGWLTLDEALAGLIVRRLIGRGNSKVSEHFVAGLISLGETK